MVYNQKPKIKVKNQNEVISLNKLLKIINNKQYENILIETYPGVNLVEFKNRFLNKLDKKYQVFWSEDFALQGQDFKQAIKNELTEDRVFGKWTRHEYKDFFIKQLNLKTKYNVCFGTGASYLLENPDLIIYIDITRWEIQCRYRNNEPVFFGNTLENETTKNFKRGYFIEWRMADKIKKKIVPKMNYYIDGTNSDFKIINSKQFFNGIKQASTKPFRLVPYFDFGVWGGQWMKEKFELGENKYGKWAWGFDGVPEENSIILQYDNNTIEMPANNLVYFETINLLGQRIWNRFGEDFPIRFDFLDTIKGQNLSLQVHPNVQYIRENFQAPYQQEESYYILDVDQKANPYCYLGVKNNIKPEEFINDLKVAQKTNKMNVEKYVNKFNVKKHDHLLHPAGVIHASGAGCMVLEISATPYIFTFKLWDWGRLGLNKKPRPINIEHGKNVIDYSFNEVRAKRELVNQFQTIVENEDYIEEKTGLHERQFIETRRITIKNDSAVLVQNHHSVNMLNLVEGEQIIVKSVDGSFDSLKVNYAETFIVPEACKQFLIKPSSKNTNKKIMVIQAFVRTNS